MPLPLLPSTASSCPLVCLLDEPSLSFPHGQSSPSRFSPSVSGPVLLVLGSFQLLYFWCSQWLGLPGSPWLICTKSRLAIIGGNQHRSRCRRYLTSDIDICCSDIGDKCVRLKNLIPISEVFRYRQQSSFRYQTLKKKKYFTLQIQTHVPWNGKRSL